MTEFLKKLLKLDGKRPSSMLVRFQDPDNKDNILCQYYSYSVWLRVENTYRQAFVLVGEPEPFYSD